MKKLLLSTSLLCALAFPGWSQSTGSDMFHAKAATGEILASDLIGMRIYASETAVDGVSANGVQKGWDDIGEVNDVILSLDGKVQAVLVDVGGFLGIGERQVAVSMPSLKLVSDDATADVTSDFFLVLNADRNALENAPGYAGTKSTDQSTNGQAETTDGSAMTANSGAAQGGLSDDQPPVPVDGNGNSQSADGQGQSQDSAGNGTVQTNTTDETAAAPQTDAGQTASSASDDTAAATGPAARNGYALVKPDALSADRLTDAEIYDAKDRHIGEVADLVLDKSGKVTDVVVDVGGFLGMGEKRVALPLSEVEIMQAENGNELRVYVTRTEEQLKGMPSYNG